jgi:hypothetical protein
MTGGDGRTPLPGCAADIWVTAPFAKLLDYPLLAGLDAGDSFVTHMFKGFSCAATPAGNGAWLAPILALPHARCFPSPLRSGGHSWRPSVNW